MAPTLKELVDAYLPAETSPAKMADNLPMMLKSLKTARFVMADGSSLSVTEQMSAMKEQERDLLFWIKRLNACLHSSDETERWVGISLLYETTSHVTLDAFGVHCSSWTASAASLLSRDGASTAIASMNVLQRTLEFSHKDPELRRSLATDQLPGIVSSLLATVKGVETGALSADLCVTAFNTIGTCATTFAGPTRVFLEKLRKASLAKFDSKYSTVAQAAARCFATLPASASSKVQADTWFTSCVELLGASHEIIGELYKGLDEEDIWATVSFAAAKIGPTPDGNIVDQLDTRVRRLKSVHTSLRQLLRNNFGCAVTLPVDAILGVIARILAADAKTLQATRGHMLLGSVLPMIFCEALDTLNVLIEVAKQHLTSRSTLITRVITQTLRSEKFVPNRQAAYSLIQKTLCYLGPVIEPTVHQDIIDFIINDSQPQQDTAASTTLPSSSTYQTRVPGGDVYCSSIILCSDALDALSSVLLISGRELTKRSHNAVSTFVLRTLFSFGSSFAGVYKDSRCRLKLYKTFRTMLLVEIASQPTCKPHAINIFTNGLQDPSEELRRFCQESLAFLDQLVHPILGSIPRKAMVEEQRVSNVSATIPKPQHLELNVASTTTIVSPPPTQTTTTMPTTMMVSTGTTVMPSEHNVDVSGGNTPSASSVITTSAVTKTQQTLQDIATNKRKHEEQVEESDNSSLIGSSSVHVESSSLKTQKIARTDQSDQPSTSTVSDVNNNNNTDDDNTNTVTSITKVAVVKTFGGSDKQNEIVDVDNDDDDDEDTGMALPDIVDEGPDSEDE